MLDGFYGFGAGVMFIAIIRFKLWDPRRVDVKQFRQPFHSSTSLFDRLLVTSCYLTFVILCSIFLSEIVDYFFLGLEYRLQDTEQHLHRRYPQYLHQDSYLLLIAHHVTSVYLIGYCSLHGSSILPVFASVGTHCFKYSGIVDFLSSSYGIITFQGAWYCYEVINLVCFVTTIWSMLACSQNWEATGISCSKKATLMWMYTVHMLNLCCNTDLIYVSKIWALLPISVWTAKASVLGFLLVMTFMSIFVFWSERASTPPKSKSA